MNAWQMIITLSLVSFNFPHVLNAISILLSTDPRSSMKEGTM